jgi:hypothetical protein
VIVRIWRSFILLTLLFVPGKSESVCEALRWLLHIFLLGDDDFPLRQQILTPKWRTILSAGIEPIEVWAEYNKGNDSIKFGLFIVLRVLDGDKSNKFISHYQ